MRPFLSRIGPPFVVTLWVLSVFLWWITISKFLSVSPRTARIKGRPLAASRSLLFGSHTSFGTAHSVGRLTGDDAHQAFGRGIRVDDRAVDIADQNRVGHAADGVAQDLDELLALLRSRA